MLHIPLFAENNEKDKVETFDVELTGTEGGSPLGKMTKCSITISDDAGI